MATLVTKCVYYSWAKERSVCVAVLPRLGIFHHQRYTHNHKRQNANIQIYTQNRHTRSKHSLSLSLSDDGRVRRRRKRRTSERVGVAARLKQQAAALEQCLLDTPSSHDHGDRY